MEEYARTFRLANLAVKKYNSNLQVCTSFTKCWAQRCYDAYGEDRDSKRWNSYAPKDILEWLGTYEKARGDYDWGIVTHPYATDVAAHSPLVIDIRDSKIVTGNYKTSPIITVTNLEIMEQYLEKKANRYGNKIRNVYLTENGFNCPENTTEDMKYQSADMAQLYYRAASLDCVKAVVLFSPTDNPGTVYNFGILKTDGTKKLSYNVWKYVDTDKASQYVDKYLDYVKLYKNKKIQTKANGGIKNWLDVMKVVDSGFNWDKIWDYDALTPVKSETKANELSLKVEGTSFGANDPINVTAEGNSSDVVGLFKSTDDPLTDEPIYWYYADGESNGLKHRSGRKYDIRVYGEVSPSRFGEATLPKGSYKIVLLQNASTIVDSVNINITSSIDKDTPSIKTDKSSYAAGEKILVTATGGTNCWAGLYGKDDTPGKRTSIYWYYINDEGSGKPSGATTVLQSTTHNNDSSNPGKVVKAGEYVLYLFDETGGDSYNIVAQTPLTITSQDLQPLRSIKYVIDDPTSGLANGTVTVKKPSGADNITDCIMYWADENGNPLDGYTSLAKFKMDSDETTVFHMYTHTIIPEGAKKLIAYSTDGTSLSDDYVSCDLPAGCTYSLDGDVLSEFQIISDIHVTTPSGATNEVKYSNDHFKMMLEDVQKNSPKSQGIFINGDMANTGQAAEFKMIYKMYKEAEKNGKLPRIHMAIGNHDWIQGNPNGQFQQYVNLFNPSIETDEVYYDEWVNGYHYIYLGGEEPGLRAVLSDKQLKWFDNLMAEDTKKDPERPVFVLLHQAMYNTCAGTLPGQNWDGVATETALRNILQKYGQIVMVGGHSHWELDSESCMYAGDEQAPVVFNTAAVGYLWTSYNIITGEYMEGSHGYYVKVYKDKIMFLGRDFVNGKYMPSAMFVVKRSQLDTTKNSYDKTTDSAIFNLDVKHASNQAVTYTSSDENVATVDDDGNVTTQGVGTCRITCAVDSSDMTVVNRQDITINVTKGNSTWTRWKYDKNTQTHSRSKKTDSSVTQTKACTKSKPKVETKATLKKAGKIQYTCSKCGGKYTENIPAIKTVEAVDLVYNGKEQTPEIVVTDADGDVVASKYYTVDKVKTVGVHKVKVKFKTRYSGSKTVKVTVMPKGVAVKEIKREKTALVVRWKPLTAKKVDGYEISVTRVNDESDTQTVTLKSANNKNKKIKGLKSGSYYYVKIRTYKTVDGENIYSEWSEPLSAVTKG